MFLSNIGRTAYFVSVTWIILTRSDSVRQVAALLLTSAAAQFVSSGIGGYLADLIDRRRLSVGFDILRALVTAEISARVSHELLEQAKSRTGIASTTELLEFALASVALEDRFIETMAKVDCTVDPDIKLGF